MYIIIICKYVKKTSKKGPILGTMYLLPGGCVNGIPTLFMNVALSIIYTCIYMYIPQRSTISIHVYTCDQSTDTREDDATSTYCLTLQTEVGQSTQDNTNHKPQKQNFVGVMYKCPTTPNLPLEVDCELKACCTLNANARSALSQINA